MILVEIIFIIRKSKIIFRNLLYNLIYVLFIRNILDDYF